MSTDKTGQMADSWTGASLDIAVIGATGVGKSSFINALRRLKPMDPGAAATDVVQARMRATAYDHPQNSGVKLWKLPGVNTREFPRRTYLEQIEFRRYDFFIIICSTRFTEDDLWFAREIQNANKRFYFVRTKVDVDIQSDKEDYPQTHDEESVKKKIKEYCISELTKSGFMNPSVFLVCKNPLKYDFLALEETLTSEIPQLKREAAQLRSENDANMIVATRHSIWRSCTVL